MNYDPLSNESLFRKYSNFGINLCDHANDMSKFIKVLFSHGYHYSKYEWLEEHVGDKWLWTHSGDRPYGVYFLNEDDAIIYKLKFQ